MSCFMADCVGLEVFGKVSRGEVEGEINQRCKLGYFLRVLI